MAVIIQLLLASLSLANAYSVAFGAPAPIPLASAAQPPVAPGAIRHRRAASAIVMMEEVECDVVIVGGGPAGCTAALYAARAQHKVVIVDKNPSVGALAITSTIANYPGVDKTMSGEHLLDQMRQQAVDYGTDYRRAQVFLVEADSDDDGYKKVYTPDYMFKAKVLVLATGAMGRKASFAGEEEYLGKGVSYCATCDGAFYKESEVAVVGTNTEAMEEATFLTKFAKTVHWIIGGLKQKKHGNYCFFLCSHFQNREPGTKLQSGNQKNLNVLIFQFLIFSSTCVNFFEYPHFFN